MNRPSHNVYAWLCNFCHIWQPGHVQFVCSVNDDDYEEILSYNELLDYIEKDEQQHQDEDGNGFWNFKYIVMKVLLELPI